MFAIRALGLVLLLLVLAPRFHDMAAMTVVVAGAVGFEVERVWMFGSLVWFVKFVLVSSIHIHNLRRRRRN